MEVNIAKIREMMITIVHLWQVILSENTINYAIKYGTKCISLQCTESEEVNFPLVRLASILAFV